MSGESEHEIATTRGEDNRQLTRLVHYVAALTTAYVRVSEELQHRNADVFHLQAQLDRVAGPPPQVPVVDPCQSPPRKRTRTGELGSPTRILPKDD